ncbi:Chaperone protein ClpB [compost metagenome]
MFKPLTLGEIEKIVDKLVDGLRLRLAEREIGLALTESAVRFIAKEGFDPVYGARPLKRFIQRSLETRVARAIIAGEAAEGSVIQVDESGNELTVTILKPEVDGPQSSELSSE